MPTLTIEPTKELLGKLQAEARRLGLTPEPLARRGIERIAEPSAVAFEEAAQYVLTKNAEWDRRLAQ